MEIQQTINIIVQPNASAQNPYAWDEPEADGVFRPENHIGQPTVKKVIEYLYLVNGIAGGLLSFALLFIVLTQSNGPLQHYKRMLLLCCSSDIGFWICDNIVEVRAKLTEGVFMITFEGPAKYASYDVQLHAMCWYVCQLTFMHTILPSQYFYRYYSVSRMRPLNTKQTLGLYFISLSATIPMYYYSYQAFRYSALIKPGVNYAKYFYDEQPIPSLLVGDLDDLRMKLYFLGATLAVGGSYALILFIAVITLKNLNFNSNKFTTKTKEMQHQLSMVLFFQKVLAQVRVGNDPSVGAVEPSRD
ncbi:unnamed protein product [Bursaphelenchus okinawaensis]|uniref:7TM_GPCR_Srx domain-containing protein n=1 Tax=Bursaphelenchus okinawaensis TaxID=465554 RepID=A0A811JRB0_9BILA|nr:unnamed protein product [Bursaphelenchus okinawaensis]CAG9079952.1 unnamed protein product [Bursaphelenchus okinawaensis]